MFAINLHSHVPFLRRELQKLIPVDSFAYLMHGRIGNELVPSGEDYFEEKDSFAAFFPTEHLFLCIQSGSGTDLDLEWLAEEDGTYIDDNGNPVPPMITPTVTGVQQLAAYGLRLIENNLQELDVCDPSTGKNIVDSMGIAVEQTFEFDGRNAHGFTEAENTSHKAECLLQAYQVLSYAHRLLVSDPLTEGEKEKIGSVNFSSLGKKGADKRHAPNRALAAWAVALYKTKKWNSANEAAHNLKDEILAHGRTIGAVISETNAQRTFAEWFNKSV